MKIKYWKAAIKIIKKWKERETKQVLCKAVSRQTDFITDKLFVDSAQSVDGSEGQHGDFGSLSMLQDDCDSVRQASVPQGTEIHPPTLLFPTGLQTADQQLLHLCHNLPYT